MAKEMEKFEPWIIREKDSQKIIGNKFYDSEAGCFESMLISALAAISVTILRILHHLLEKKDRGYEVRRKAMFEN